MATRGTIDRTEGSGEQDEQTARTVALVDLRPPPGSSGDHGSVGPAMAFELALQKIEKVVRGDDRVCPFGITRVAIAFGPDAEAVTAKTLGERLARAVRQNTVADDQVDPRRGPEDTTDVRRPRVGGSENGNPLRAARTIPASTTVTVDRVLGGARLITAPGAGSPVQTGSSLPPIRPAALTPRLRHRTVVRYSTNGFAQYGTRHDDPSAPGNKGTILVVSPNRTSGSAPGMSAVAAAALAERLGFEVEAVALTCEDALVLDLHGAALDLVVLVVEGEREPTGELANWTSSNWNIPAQLAARYYSEGIGVLAVGAGGGAGALAGCVAQRATVLLDHDELQAELRNLAAVPGDDESWVASGSGFRIPQAMVALVHLTASERRVLFYLTTGKSAQDIADDLVVSVTTVRSHIRSILRKLGVRSQLAAVAIANSQDFGRSQASTSMLETQRELEAPGVA